MSERENVKTTCPGLTLQIYHLNQSYHFFSPRPSPIFPFLRENNLSRGENRGEKSPLPRHTSLFSPCEHP